jgi:hypothetical protein
MTYPSETAMNQMAAEDETDMPETGMPETDMVETDMPETDMPETDMFQRVPAPAEPLPAETPAFPTDMLEHVPAPAEPLPAETPAFPAASATASLSARWHEILATFVDDPRSSAEMAADLVDESVQALVASVKEQQDSLLAAWHGENASTEELRTAVQHYRAFGGRLADFTSEA